MRLNEESKQSKIKANSLSIIYMASWGMNEKMDRRLVSTFFGLVMAILMHRHRNQARNGKLRW